MKKIMAIGAHVLDAEISCGMTLAKHAKEGDKIVTIAITAGENGRPQGFSKEEFRQINLEGAAAFAKALDGKFICMNYTDSMVPDNESICDELAEIIREEKPDIVLTHWEGSSHDDHNLTSKIVRRAVRRARYTDGKTYSAHREIELYYAENWEDMDDFVPYLYVDVTGGYELWKEAVQNIYLSTKAKYFNYLEYYDALSIMRGTLARRRIPECKRAEAFAISNEERARLFEVKKSF